MMSCCRKKNAASTISEYDLVIDATDMIPARYLINDTCVALNKPFIYGAIYKYQGQVAVFNYNNGPTYRCLFPDEPKEQIQNCDQRGGPCCIARNYWFNASLRGDKINYWFRATLKWCGRAF